MISFAFRHRWTKKFIQEELAWYRLFANDIILVWDLERNNFQSRKVGRSIRIGRVLECRCDVWFIVIANLEKDLCTIHIDGPEILHCDDLAI